MMNKFDCTTPRPWNKAAIYELLRYARKVGGQWDDVDLWPKDDSLNMPDEHDADLVAAAPDLYEALQDLLSRVANDKDAHSWWCDAQEKAIKALSKARGTPAGGGE